MIVYSLIENNYCAFISMTLILSHEYFIDKFWVVLAVPYLVYFTAQPDSFTKLTLLKVRIGLNSK